MSVANLQQREQFSVLHGKTALGQFTERESIHFLTIAVQTNFVQLIIANTIV